MGKKILIEETMRGSLSLCENKNLEVHPGCLGTMYGPCADYNNPTRNNNMYGRKLWVNSFNDPLVKEALEDRILLGELDHPSDGRLETQAANAAIVMTEYEFKDDEGLLYGTFDILDTPNGRILKSLLDYGCKIGVSSRGEGDVVTKEGIDYVDENSYTFVGFDAVALPAVKAAKPTLRESLDFERSTLKESLLKEIQTATTTSVLDLIKKVVEATNLPDSDSLMESINIKSTELDGTPSSSNLMEDLESSTRALNETKEENRLLKESVTTCKERISKMMKSYRKVSESLKELRSEVTSKSKEFEELQTQLSSKNQEITNLMREHRNAEIKLRSRSRLTESQLRSEMSRLEVSLDKSQASNRKSLEESRQMKSRLLELEEEVKNLKKQNSALASKLEESIQERSKDKADSEKSQTQLIREYVVAKSKIMSVDPKQVLESIESRKSVTIQEVNRLIESIADRNDRYRSVPSMRDSSLFTKSAKVRTEVVESNEDKSSRDFMEQAVKLL